MTALWLMAMLTATAQESCYDDWHVYSPWFPHPSLSFGTAYHICGICGYPEIELWLDDA